MAGLLGETVTLNAKFSVLLDVVNNQPVFYTATWYSNSFVVTNGVEILNLPVTGTFTTPQGYTGTVSGTITVDVANSSYSVNFAGTQQPGDIYFEFTSLRGESIATIGSIAATNSGFTEGLNYAYSPELAGTGITTRLGTLGQVSGVNLTQNVTFSFTPSAPSNTPPVAVGDSYSINEDSTLNGSTVLANDSDVQSDPLTAILVSGPSHATSFSLNSNGTFTYTPTANYSGSDTFTYKANDGKADSNTVTVNIAVNAVNDAPNIGTSAGATAFSEGVNVASTPVAIDPSLTLNDPDNSTLASAIVQITGNLRTGQDSLAFVNNDAAAFGNIVASYVANTGTLTLTSAGSTATVAQFRAALRAVAYINSSQEPNEGDRTISFSANDGTATSLIATKVVTVTAYNDSPSGSDATVMIGEDAVRTLSASDFGFSDIDGDAFAHVQFTSAPVGGTLFFDADGPGGGGAPVAVTDFPTGNYTVADLAAGRVTFVPTANLNGPGIASVQFIVGDDGGNAGPGLPFDQTPNTLTFNIDPVNDAPVNSIPSAQSVLEDQGIVFSAGNGNALAVSDPDAMTLTVTLSVAHGALTFANTTDLTFTDGDGTNDQTVTFSGTPAAINAAFNAGITVAPEANYNGANALTFSTIDNGQAGGGPVGTDSKTVTINVASVNDAPSGSDNRLTGSENDPIVLTAADFGFSDVVEGNALAGVRIMSFPTNGALMLDPDGPGGAAPINLASSGPGVTIGISEINAGHFYFLPDADEAGSNYASFTFRVQDSGGVSNGGVDTDPTPNTITIDLTPDNRAPVVKDDVANALEDVPTSLWSVAVGNDFDPEGGKLNIVAIDLEGTKGSVFFDPATRSLVYNANTAFFDDLPPGVVVTDSFKYVVEDEQGARSTATITVNVNTTVSGVNVTLGEGSQNFSGGGLEDYIDGGSGNDTLSGFGEDDVLIGAKGNDLLDGGDGLDVLNAGDGNDTLIGGAGADRLDGGAGRDLASYRTASGGVVVSLTNPGAGTGDAAGDTFVSIEDLEGSAFADVLGGTDAANDFFGGAGDDTVSYAWATGGVVASLANSITLTNPVVLQKGAAAGDRYNSIEMLEGSAFNDTLSGTNAGETLSGLGGNDMLSGLQGDDTLLGGEGADTLSGGAGTDWLYGGASADTLRGDEGNDRLFGDDGADILEGGAGADTLNGGAGNDNCTGGNGADIFVITDLGNTDTITDFSRGQGDKIDLSSLNASNWIGSQNFTGHAGEVRQVNLGSQFQIQGDVDGNGTADFFINVGKSALVATDVIYSSGLPF